MLERAADESADRTDADDPIREQLLAAAAKVFSEKGYSGTKIKDIVKASGLSSGALYGRFSSKDELLVEAVIGQVERSAVRRRFEGRTVGEVLVDSGRAHGALSDAEATQLEAFIAARRQPQVAEAIAEAREQWRATIAADMIRRAIDDGTADADADFPSVVYFMESLNLGLMVQRGAGQYAPDAEAWSRFLERVIRTMATTDHDARGEEPSPDG
ncbi:MAG: TetR family transcriptional regulator [Acidimicrobiales bacterium]